MPLKKIIVLIAAAAAGLAVALYAAVWALGERILQRRYETPALAASHSTDAKIIAEGERLADVTGCTGCHGGDLNGVVLEDAPFVFRWVSTNLPRLAATYSDEDLARAIRFGVKRNRRSVIGMPSPSFADLRDEDMTAMVSFIRSQPDKGERLPKNEALIVARWEFLQGLYPPEASQIDPGVARRDYDFSDPVQHGEYLARIACSECHGLNFEGEDGAPAPGVPPDLMIAAAYPLDHFRHLMRNGEAMGGRDLEMMDDIARSRFTSFTDEEIDALHAFFVHRAEAKAD